MFKSKRSHKAIPESEWRGRLDAFARGDYTFGRGERPGKGTKWGKRVDAIAKCPAHGRQRSAKLFAPVECTCGHHERSHQSPRQTSDKGIPPFLPESPSTRTGEVASSDVASSSSSVTTSSGTAGESPSTIPSSSGSVTSSPSPTVPTRVPPTSEVAAPWPRAAFPSTPTISAAPLPSGVTSSATGTSSGTDLARVLASLPTTVPASVAGAKRQHGRPTSLGLASVTGTSVTAPPVTCAGSSSESSVAATPAAGDVPTSSETPSDSTAGPSATEETTAGPSAYQMFGDELPPRSKSDPTMRLPAGWRTSMREADQEWVGEHLFRSKGAVKEAAYQQLWHYPPVLPVVPMGTKPHDPKYYFTRRLVLWAPRRSWGYNFSCPKCGSNQLLTSKGVYPKNVREVIDMTDVYYIACEYLGCKKCDGAYRSYDPRIMEQLPDHRRALFPAVLTYKLGCDKSVISLLHSRTLGNSPNALRNSLLELHSETWMKKQLQYSMDCINHESHWETWRKERPVFAQPPQPPRFPTSHWFANVYLRDIMSRLPEILATVTSVFGDVLKIDSTKKVCKKLQGTASGSASWCTNVANSRGEVLVSVLTPSEGLEGLRPMAKGLVERYRIAGQSPPKVLYTDRDCCSSRGPSMCALLFEEWDDLIVRLDIWHFMRRLGRGCTTESHPLFGEYCKRLSQCIFEWDRNDYELLLEAKRGQLRKKGLRNPSDQALRHAVSANERALHCRRRTRGTAETTRLIDELLTSLTGAEDALGTPLLREDIKEIWAVERQHVKCIQDPEGMLLYTRTGFLTKGGVQLPVYRCARGTTSLESFHLHLARFIPGTSASEVLYQGYLLEGLSRWNQSRARAAVSGVSGDHHRPGELHTFDVRLAAKLNKASHKLWGTTPLPRHTIPMRHTNEAFGVEYLYRTSTDEAVRNDNWRITDEMVDAAETAGDRGDTGDEGFSEDTDVPTLSEDPGTFAPDEEDANDDPSSSSDDDDEAAANNDNTTGQGPSQVVDSSFRPGWDKVGKLAEVLVNLSGFGISEDDAKKIKQLYDDLDEYDKRMVKSLMHLQEKYTPRGRFLKGKGKEKAGYDNTLRTRRYFVSGHAPHLNPARSRIVEAIITLLCNKYPCSTQASRGPGGTRRPYLSRWRKVLHHYEDIRSRVYNNRDVLQSTQLALFAVNQTTLQEWFKNRDRARCAQSAMQGLQLPNPPVVADEPLEPEMELPDAPEPVLPSHSQHVMQEPEVDTMGTAVRRRRRAAEEVPFGSTPIPMTTSAPATSSPATLVAGTAGSSSTVSVAAAITQPSQTAVPQPATLPLSSDTVKVSRTTLWRERKRQAECESQGIPYVKKSRKEYSCGTCRLPINSDTGHRSYMGRRYCPQEHPGVSADEWMKTTKDEYKRQKQEKAHQASLSQQSSSGTQH